MESACGEFEKAELAMLTSARNVVMMRVILDGLTHDDRVHVWKSVLKDLAGTESGGMKKLIHETMTQRPEGT